MQSLKGNFLVAMSHLDGNAFGRTVIFMIEHSDKGAMGVVINQNLDLKLSDILDDLDIEEHSSPNKPSFSIGSGGPVDPARGFVLHTTDYFEPKESMRVTPEINVSSNKAILEAIAHKETAPQNSLLLLGYAGWGAGQLEQEMARNDWLHVEASSEIVFDIPFEDRYDFALKSLGLTAANLSALSGEG